MTIAYPGGSVPNPQTSGLCDAVSVLANKLPGETLDSRSSFLYHNEVMATKPGETAACEQKSPAPAVSVL